MIDYFDTLYQHLKANWNVEEALESFGAGYSNEGSEESTAILRYYVKPNDQRFSRIYLNFNKKRNVESVVWFLNEPEMLNLAQLFSLFGPYEIQNVIYDDTTNFVFFPQDNKAVKSVSATVYDWVTKAPDDSLYFENTDKKFKNDDNYSVSQIIMYIDTD